MAARKAKKKQEQAQPDYLLHMPFAHKVLERDWGNNPKLNTELKAGVWKARAKDPQGLYRSNMAGTWHSKDGLLETLGEPGQELMRMFGAIFSKWGEQYGLKEENYPDLTIGIKMSAWAMVYSDRGYATVHSHPNCHVSGVYYVDNDAEMPEKIMATGLHVRAGDIEFYPPMAREFQVPYMRFNDSFVVPYKTGKMLAFPSYLQHMVHPMHTKGGERISIACNGTFTSSPKKQEIP